MTNQITYVNDNLGERRPSNYRCPYMYWQDDLIRYYANEACWKSNQIMHANWDMKDDP